MAERLLIVDDEIPLCESLRRIFLREGFEVGVAGSGEEALSVYKEGAWDLVLSDILLPGMDGIELLQAIKAVTQDQIVIMMTAYASIETAVAALRAGAYDYILKPVIHDEIKRLVRMALNERTLRRENILLRRQIAVHHDFGNIIGKSAALLAVLDQVKKVADSRSNVFVLGETGTGKELFTRAIHYGSSRRNRNFIPINCSAIPEHLLESELFGYVKGAFTGASQSKRGLFEEADQGTVFLDEVADLSHGLQAKLLRVIDDHEIRPLGSTQSRKVDIRFVAATNKDVDQAIRSGTLREDLYYRLNVVTLRLPPLRERKEDIPLLARTFLRRFSGELGKRIAGFDNTAMRILGDYSWPGNVRELQNIVERAVLIAEGRELLPEHLPEGIRRNHGFQAEALERALSIEAYTKAFIRRYQTHLTERSLAEALGITRKALWEKRKRWGLERPKSAPLPPGTQEEGDIDV